MWWYIVVAFVAAFAATAIGAPKPPKPDAATFDDFEAPVAREGDPIPVLFGTREIKGLNCVWYGDLKVIPIRKKGGKK